VLGQLQTPHIVKCAVSNNRDGFREENLIPVTRSVPKTFRKNRRSIIAASLE